MRASIAACYPGRDLRELVTGRMTPDECWDLLSHLPADSALMSALADDAEYAAWGDPQPPKMAEFGPVVQALAGIYDLQAALLRTVSAAVGGRPPEVRPYPRPVTAGEKARRDQARREFEELDRYLTGGSLSGL